MSSFFWNVNFFKYCVIVRSEIPCGGSSCRVETSQLICFINQWAGFVFVLFVLFCFYWEVFSEQVCALGPFRIYMILFRICDILKEKESQLIWQIHILLQRRFGHVSSVHFQALIMKKKKKITILLARTVVLIHLHITK